jgi:hypothetical protein
LFLLLAAAAGGCGGHSQAKPAKPPRVVNCQQYGSANAHDRRAAVRFLDTEIAQLFAVNGAADRYSEQTALGNFATEDAVVNRLCQGQNPDSNLLIVVWSKVGTGEQAWPGARLPRPSASATP